MQEQINLESSYDARQKFFEEWQQDEKILRELIVKKEFEQYLNILINSICRLPLDVRRDIGNYEQEYEIITKLIEKYHNHDSFNNKMFIVMSEKIQREIFIKLMNFRTKIIDSMQKSKLLLPLNLGKIDENNPDVVANAWRNLK